MTNSCWVLLSKRAGQLVIFACALFLTFSVISCSAQNQMADVARSHIEANVPAPDVFDNYMKRDLGSYLCNGIKNCHVEYQLLRQGPTQTGISYPKFYVWAKCSVDGQLKQEGAARVAAIDKEAFQVTTFLSKEQIATSPSQVGSIFPASLVNEIVHRAR